MITDISFRPKSQDNPEDTGYDMKFSKDGEQLTKALTKLEYDTLQGVLKDFGR